MLKPIGNQIAASLSRTGIVSTSISLADGASGKPFVCPNSHNAAGDGR